MVKTFEIDPHDTSTVVAEALDFIDDYLSRLRMNGVEENRCMLMFEESLVTLLEHVNAGQPQKVTVRTRHLFGTLTITMTVAG